MFHFWVGVLDADTLAVSVAVTLYGILSEASRLFKSTTYFVATNTIVSLIIRESELTLRTADIRHFAS